MPNWSALTPSGHCAFWEISFPPILYCLRLRCLVLGPSSGHVCKVKFLHSSFASVVASTFDSFPVANFHVWEFLWVRAAGFPSLLLLYLLLLPEGAEEAGLGGWRRGPVCLGGWGAGLRGSRSWHRWLGEGLLERPGSDAYTAVLVCLELLKCTLRYGHSGKFLCILYHD